MKKILSPKTPERQAAHLRSRLRELVLAHNKEVAALHGEMQISEAWAMRDTRVKVHGQVRLRDDSHHTFVCTVPFEFPPERQSAYRDWKIVVRPTWYGFRYLLSDEEGRAVGARGDVDLATAAFAEEKARREINQLIADRTRPK